MTVVLKALIAQSNMAQPKISRLSLTMGCAVVVMDGLLYGIVYQDHRMI
jgi:hypothetical protein